MPIQDSVDAAFAQYQAQQAQQQAAQAQQPAMQAKGGDSVDAAFAQYQANPNAGALSAPQEQPGFWAGVANQTIAPFAHLASQYYQNAQQLVAQGHNPTVASTLAMAHLVSQVAQNAYQQGKSEASQAVQSAKAAGSAEVQGLSSLAHGNVQQAQQQGQQVAENTSLALGHGLAAALPAVGPAAAQVGQDIATNPSYGAGEATGLIGSMLAPEAISKGVGKVAGKLAPTSTKIADTTIPVRSDSAVANLASPSRLEAFDKSTQQAGKAALGNVADQATQETLKTVRGTMIASPQQILPHVSSFGEGADALRASAKEVYSALDQATQGKWQIAQDARSEALGNIRRGVDVTANKAKLAQAESTIQDIIKQQSGLFNDTTAVSKANAAYRQAGAMDELQTVIDHATAGTPENIQANVTASGKAIAQEPRVISANRLRQGLNRLNDSGELDNALGANSAHKQALFNLADTLKIPAGNAKFSRVIGYMDRYATEGGVLAPAFGHMKAGLGAIAYGAGRIATGQLLGAIMTSPRAAQTLYVSMRSGASAGVIAQRLGDILQQEHKLGGNNAQ